MEFKIGDNLFIGKDSYQLSPPVQGLESPAIRTGDGLYAGRDGGYFVGHFYGYRTIVLNGFYIGSDCEDAAELGMNLTYYLQIRKNLPILITLNDGTQYYTEGRITDIKSDVENLKASKFQITLLCQDPIFYKAEEGEVVWNEEVITDGESNRNLVQSIGANWVTSNASIAETDGVFKMTAGPNVLARCVLPLYGLVEGETYVVSLKVKSVSVSSLGSAYTYARVRELSTGGNWIGNSQRMPVTSDYAAYSFSFTATSVTNPFLWFYLTSVNTNTNNIEIYVKDIQLESGSTATDYKPYGESPSIIAKNNGDVEIAPIITVSGATDGIEIANNTTEQTMQLDVETESGDTVVIDMDKRIITLNGNAINETRSLSSTWWGLLLENNEIRATVDLGASVEIKWRDGYSGI